MNIWIPLQGATSSNPKAPSVPAWTSPTYEGVDPGAYDGWLGLRTDDHVVVDCDTQEAADAWRERSDYKATWIRQTPHGFHFIYSATPGSPTGPMVGVFPDTDIRAGRTSQIVFRAPGYEDITDQMMMHTFDSTWLPEKAATPSGGADWATVPVGKRNSTLASFAGALRKQGMGFESLLYSTELLNRANCVPPLPVEEVGDIVRSMMRYEPEPDIEIRVGTPDMVDGDPRWLDSSKMTLPPPQQWLWKPYLPAGRLILLDGEESVGKGLFTVWAAVHLLSGNAFPGGAVRDASPVLWLTSEDDPREDVYRRLLAAGYDPGRHDRVRFYNPRMPQLGFPADVAELEAEILKHQAKLVILDPGRSYLQPPHPEKGRSFNSDADMQPGLHRLLFLAQDTHATILFVHHWNKMSEGTTRQKTGGSGVFRQVCRHEVSLAKVGEHRALSVEKANNSASDFTVCSFAVDPVDELDSARFQLGGELLQYANLTEWIDTIRKLDAETEMVISVRYDWKSAALHYGTLNRDAMAPSVKELCHDLGVDPEDAKAILAEWRDAKVIVGRRWWGLPPDLKGVADWAAQ